MAYQSKLLISILLLKCTILISCGDGDSCKGDCPCETPISEELALLPGSWELTFATVDGQNDSTNSKEGVLTIWYEQTDCGSFYYSMENGNHLIESTNELELKVEEGTNFTILKFDTQNASIANLSQSSLSFYMAAPRSSGGDHVNYVITFERE